MQKKTKPKTYPYLAPYYKNSKYIGLNVKSKTVNLVEVNKI